MSELNREQIIKALECCSAVDFDISTCDRCPFEPKEEGKGSMGCNDELMRNALALIKKLTEENERLREKYHEAKTEWGKATEYYLELENKYSALQVEHYHAKADTVRKMHELLLKLWGNKFSQNDGTVRLYTSVLEMVLLQSEKELLEGRQ